MIPARLAVPSNNGCDPFLSILQVTSSAFPTGSFSHSYGFECWLADRTIATPEEAEIRLRDWLRFTVATADAVAVAHAFRAALYTEMAGIAKLNRTVEALKLSREARQASAKSGAAFMAAFRDIFRLEVTQRLALIMDAHGQRPHHAVVYGVACAGMGWSETQTVETYLYGSFSGLAAVLGRLLPIGQSDLQRIIAAAAPLILECSEIARTRPLNGMSTLNSALDVASMRHERLPSRLCMS